MSSAAERAKAKAARMSASARPAPVLSDEDDRQPDRPEMTRAAVAPARAARSETVKSSIHLAPELHREFTSWCLDAAHELGRGRVNGSDVVRVLLRRLLADEAVQADVIEALRRDGRR